MNVENNNLKQKVWDLGPVRPEAPKPPVAPEEASFKGASKVADYEVAKIQFDDALIDYKSALRIYADRMAEYSKWRRDNGGPVEIEMWSVNAREALANDPERYRRALPKGEKPGKTDHENKRKAELRLIEDAAAAKRDPHFGEGIPA